METGLPLPHVPEGESWREDLATIWHLQLWGVPVAATALTLLTAALAFACIRRYSRGQVLLPCFPCSSRPPASQPPSPATSEPVSRGSWRGVLLFTTLSRCTTTSQAGTIVLPTCPPSDPPTPEDDAASPPLSVLIVIFCMYSLIHV